MRYLIDLFDPSKWYVPRVSTKLHYRKNDNKETTTPIRSIARGGDSLSLSVESKDSLGSILDSLDLTPDCSNVASHESKCK